MSADPRPWPPPDFAKRRLRTVVLPVETVLTRFFSKGYDPIFFDRSMSGRLNAPEGSYGVLYVAQRDAGAFAETFLRTPGRTLLPVDLIEAKARVRLRLERPLNLVQMHGAGLAAIGATAEVTSGGLPYDLSQRWSKSAHDHPMNLDGIAYRARHDDDEICYALFDRSASALREEDRTVELDEDWFFDLMDRYEVGLAPF